MIKNIGDLANSIDGNLIYSSYRKAPASSATTNTWHDLSMTTGYPSPNYYASTPASAKVMRYSTNGGIYHGQSHPTKDKYLFDVRVCGNTSGYSNCPFMLLDYLMYYPFLDEGDTSVQNMDNTETLTRYTDGKGVQVMAVSVAQRTGGASFRFTYINQDGVEKLSPIIFQNSSVVNGSVIASASGSSNHALLFCPLANGDSGVRSIKSVQMLTTDTGLFTLVLVKPLATFATVDFNAPMEKNFHYDNAWALPKIEDDAYLNVVRLSNNAYTGISLLINFSFLYK